MQTTNKNEIKTNLEEYMEFSRINPFVRFAIHTPAIEADEKPHIAYDCRLFYCESGGAEFSTEKAKYEISDGTAIFVPPATPYAFSKRIKAHIINFDITRNASDKISVRPPSPVNEFDKSLLFDKTELPQELCEPIISHGAFNLADGFSLCSYQMSLSDGFCESVASGAAKEILSQMAQAVSHEKANSFVLASRIKTFICENYSEKIGNDEVAKALGYHSYYLNRVFKSCFGTTIHKALVSERIRVSKHLLSETELSIEQIALKVGFEDRRVFLSAFESVVGISPSEYRRR